MDARNLTFHLPYAGLLPQLVDSIFDALADLSGAEGVSVLNERLNSHFTWLRKRPRGKDPHLYLSLESEKSLRSESENVPHTTRIANLLRRTFTHSDAFSSANVSAFLPSPLHVLHEYLTVPDEPASRAYAFITLRTLLFSSLRIWPLGRVVPTGYRTFNYDDVEEAIRTIKTYASGRDNIPLGGAPAKVLLCHLLASQGLMHFRFGRLKDKTNVDPTSTRLAYCRLRQIAPEDGFEFRLTEEVAKLPEAGEIINELWGVPIPIRGADTVFFGGLKFASEGGAVAGITGAAGTGKTSMALALAAVLAPMGARTYFVTAEESSADLKARLATLVPDYLSELSLFPARQSESEWFRAERLSPVENIESSASLLRKIVTDIADAVMSSANDIGSELPLPCPLMIVLDGLQSYLKPPVDDIGAAGSAYTVQELVADCRQMGALVIFTATESEDQPQLSQIDHHVDVALRLEYRNTELTEDKPIRVLIVRKTRLQLSRPGAHVCHLSGPEGFRICPQLPSQLDRRSVFKVGLPDESRIIEVLNRPFYYEELVKIDYDKEIRNPKLDMGWSRYLSIYRRSQILLHGRGSSGKSGLGLKLLMAPLFNPAGEIADTPKRTLVVSFLYPHFYYDLLRDKLNKVFRFEYDDATRRKHALEVLHFLPGFLNPEDLFERINGCLDKADLEGEPFDGVLLDGLHNVFLQFPRLARNSMVWPMLYGMLRTRDLTAVTTHTTFSVANDDKDSDLVMGEARPLLHALVQAAEYYFEVEPSRTGVEDFFLRVRASITPLSSSTQTLFWNREKMVFHTGVRQLDMLASERS